MRPDFLEVSKKTEALAPKDSSSQEPDPQGLWPFLRALFFTVPPETNHLYFYARAALFLVLLIWGDVLIFSSIESNRALNSFWHLVNLPFHEAGHIFFRLFGGFMASLGGSLFQLLMPVICAVVLLVKTRDNFGVSVCVWWLQNSGDTVLNY